MKNKDVFIKNRLPLFMVMCPTEKGTAIKKSKVYTSLHSAKMAVAANPTNNRSEKWRIYEIKEVEEVE